MVVRICDKCGKKTEKPEDVWSNDHTLFGNGTYHNGFYDYMTDKVIKIKKQVLQMKIGFYLECGDSLDLCNKCAKKIIHAKVDFKR